MDIAYEDVIILTAVCVLGALGLLASTTLLLLTTTKELRTKGYMAFVINRAAIDFGLCLHLITLQPLGIRMWINGSPIWCDFASCVCSTLMSAVVSSEPLLAFNRYVSVCRNHQYSSIFRKRNVYLMCAGAWLVAFLLTLPHIVLGNLGRVEGVICQVQLSKQSSFIVYLFCDQLAALGSYALIMVYHWKIMTYIRRHQTQEMANGRMSRLQEDKELLRCISTLAVFPLITSIPIGVCSIVFMSNPEDMPDLVLCIVNVLFLLLPITNSVSTILIVRPIRKHFLVVIRRLVKRDWAGGGGGSSSAVAPAAITSPIASVTIRVLSKK